MESRQRHHVTRPGFTLVELIVILALIGILAAVSFPGFAESRQRANVSKVADEVVSFVRDAQSRSMAAANGVAWKFVCHGSTVSVESVNLPPTIITHALSSVTCPAESVEFQKLTGRPTTPITFRLQQNAHTEKLVVIGAAGSITLQQP